jgi:hypothetical protein
VQCSKDHKANRCPANKTASNKNGSEDATKQQCIDITAATAGSNNTESQSKYLPVDVLKEQSASRPKKRIRRSSNNDDSDDDDQPGWNITDEMKQLIQRSDWLRKELNDGGLRHLIGEIDAASDVEEEDEADNDTGGNNYKRRKNNWGRKDRNNKNGNAVDDISPRVLALARTKHSHPKFAAFMDKLLLTAGVLTDGTGGGEEGEGCGRLELVPVPRRGGERTTAAATDDQESQSEEDDSASDSNEEEGGGSSDEDDDSEE